MQIRELELAKLACEPLVLLRRVVVSRHVVERAEWRDADRRPAGADGMRDRGRDFDREAVAVLERAAVSIAALVRSGIQELLDQIAVRAVELDAVEACFHPVLRRRDELRDHARDLARRKGARRRERLEPRLIGPHLAGRGDRRGRDGLRARGQVVIMSDPARVHELKKDLGSACVSGCRDFLPAFRLRCRERARDACIPQRVRRRRCAFGHDQARTRALPVILRHQIVRHITNRAAARHRRHHESIAEREITQRVRL